MHHIHEWSNPFTNGLENTSASSVLIFGKTRDKLIFNYITLRLTGS